MVTTLDADVAAYLQRETARLLDGRVRLCACGCGKATKLATRTSKRYGHIKGRPVKFLSGHNSRGRGSGIPYKSPERWAYRDAKFRCDNPKAPNYAQYGGRGIRFLFRNYEEFLLNLGPRPTPGHSLERHLLDGPYCPANCYWATRDVQEANKRHNNQHCAGRPMTYDIEEILDCPY